MPIGITESEDVFSHDEAEGYHDSFVWDGGEALAVTLEIVSNDVEGVCGVYVCVHQHGVGGEQFGVGWRIQGDDEIL